jgi:hypothetical protein
MKLTKEELSILAMMIAMPDNVSHTTRTPLLRSLFDERALFRKALVEIVKQAGLSTARDIATDALKGTV